MKKKKIVLALKVFLNDLLTLKADVTGEHHTSVSLSHLLTA